MSNNLKMLKHLSVYFVVSLLLSACASTPQTLEPKHIETGKAIIVELDKFRKEQGTVKDSKFYAGKGIDKIINGEQFSFVGGALDDDHYGYQIWKQTRALSSGKHDCDFNFRENNKAVFFFAYKVQLKQKETITTATQVYKGTLDCNELISWNSGEFKTLRFENYYLAGEHFADNTRRSVVWLDFESTDKYTKNDPLKKWRSSKKIVEAVNKETVFVGMPEDAMLLAMGKPETVNNTVTKQYIHKQYVYGTTYIYVENGKVTSFQF